MNSYIICLTPFITGFVGYFTNYLAIKMLFRPYKPKWYTFGFVGIIPKTRRELSKNIAELVAEKLVTSDDLQLLVLSEKFSKSISCIIEQNLYNFIKDPKKVNDIVNKKLYSFIVNISSDEAKVKKINEAFKNFFNYTLLNLENFSSVNIFLHDNLKKILLTIIESRHSINDVFGFNTEKLSFFLVENINKIITSIFSDKEMASLSSTALIELNKNLKALGVSSLSRKIMKLFISDNMISKVVLSKFSCIGEYFVSDKTIQEKIYKLIHSKVHFYLYTPIKNWNLPYSSEELSQTIVNIIIGTPDTFQVGILYNLISSIKKIKADKKNDYFEYFSVIIDNIHILSKTISILITKVIPSQIINISHILVSSFLSNTILAEKKILEKSNIKKLVENKINSFDLSEIEYTLFSFMSIHFKWINALGFILGFIIGLIQAILSLFLSI